MRFNDGISKRFFRVIFLFFLVAFGIHQTANAFGRQSIIYLNGTILTMDAENTIAEAVALKRGKIQAVGSNQEIEQLATRWSKIVDLKGKTMVPGFIDAHSHFPASGAFIQGYMADLNSPPIGNVNNFTQLMAKLTIQANSKKPGQWVLGMGYDDTLLPENRHPTRWELDQVSTEHPIWIYHISGHLGVANSLGLAMAGITLETPNPEGGVIRRDPLTGEATGLLEENAKLFMDEVATNTDIFTAYKIAKAASTEYLSMGITTAQSANLDTLKTTGMIVMANLGLLPLRVVIWPDRTVGDKMSEGRFDNFFTRIFRKEWIKLGAIKLIADGSIQGYTGYLTEPYFSEFNDDPMWRGYPTLSRDQLVTLVKRYHNAGLQVAIHGNGDAAIDDILYAFRAAQEENHREDARPLIVHSQMAREDQLDEMQALQVSPTFFGLHTYYWGDRHRDTFIGPQRAARISPAGSAVDRGIRFTLHSDTPIVPMSPLRMVWNGVNRITSSGKVLGEGQRLSVMQALRAVTIDAAWQAFEEHSRGSIEPGKLADLVILSDNPLNRPATIDQIEIVETVIGGKQRYRNSAY